MKNKGKILGIDFGAASVGLAITDEQQTMVFGRGVIKKYGSLQNLAKKLHQLCEQENAVKVVMGLPIAVAEKSQSQTQKIRNIGKKLRLYLHGIDFEFQDESFSSFEAREALKKLDVKAKNYKKTEDEMAAIIILQNYLKIHSTIA